MNVSSGARRVAGTPATALPRPGQLAQSVRPKARALLSWAPVASVVALGLFLRLYGWDGFVTFYPDSYGQLRAAENLVSGEFPISSFYPPGVALFLAPFFALLPDTLLTMQVAIMVAGLALIVFAYLACWAATGDRRAAIFFASGVALATIFVAYSRFSMFDGINTLLVALCLFLAPRVAERGLPALLGYGLLAFAMVTVRYTNVIVLPALFLASLELSERPFTRRLVWERLRSRPVVTVGLVLVALYGAYVGLSYGNLSRLGGQGGSLIDPAGYPLRSAQYLKAGLIGYGDDFSPLEAPVIASVLAFAAVGACRLWQTNRGLLIPILSLLVAWVLVHALYVGFWSRYALPAFFFVLLLAAVGLSASLDCLARLPRSAGRAVLALGLMLALVCFVGWQVIQDAALIGEGEAEAAAREDAYEEIRTALRELDGERSVLVSLHALAVDRANPEVATYDLIRHANTYGIDEDSLDRFLAYVREQQAAGKSVYFHHTGFDDAGKSFHRHELGYDAFFAALQRAFSLRELVRTAGEEQRLYVVEPET